jgi:hypothetical protein
MYKDGSWNGTVEGLSSTSAAPAVETSHDEEE